MYFLIQHKDLKKSMYDNNNDPGTYNTFKMAVDFTDNYA